MQQAVWGWRGVAVSIEAPDDLLADLTRQLPDFYEPTGNVIAQANLHADDAVVTVELPEGLTFTGGRDDATMRAAASRIELLVCAALPDRVGVHAGVVSFADRAIVVPGTSMAGKSTIVRALIDAGATYFSDEFALVDADGLVWPYPRPVTLRNASGRARHLPTPAAAPDGPPVRLGVLAALTYSPDGWQVQRLSAAQAALAMLANSLSAQRDAPRTLNYLAAAVTDVPVLLSGTRDDADTSAGRLLTALTDTRDR